MAEQAVLKFLEEHNRPFSINDIHNNLKEFGKTSLQKALDSLIEKEEVTEKIYGKQKVYHIKQNSSGSTSANDFKENLLEMDRKINEKTLQLKEVSDKLKENSQQFSKNKNQVSLPEAIEKKMKLEEELRNVKTKLNNFKDSQMIKPEDKKKIQQNYDKQLNEYKKRKRMCLDILGNILENYPKSKKDLYEDIGIETDEDAEFVLQNL